MLKILLDIDFSYLLQKEWEPLPFSVTPAKIIGIDTLKKVLRTHFESTSSYTAGNNSRPLLRNGEKDEGGKDQDNNSLKFNGAIEKLLIQVK